MAGSGVVVAEARHRAVMRVVVGPALFLDLQVAFIMVLRLEQCQKGAAVGHQRAEEPVVETAGGQVSPESQGAPIPLRVFVNPIFPAEPLGLPRSATVSSRG